MDLVPIEQIRVPKYSGLDFLFRFIQKNSSFFLANVFSCQGHFVFVLQKEDVHILYFSHAKAIPDIFSADDLQRIESALCESVESQIPVVCDVGVLILRPQSLVVSVLFPFVAGKCFMNFFFFFFCKKRRMWRRIKADHNNQFKTKKKSQLYLL